MNPRIYLGLLLVAGCSDPIDASDTSDTSAPQSTGTSQASDSDAAPTTGDTTATTSTGSTTDTTAATEQGGSHGASQSGSGGPQDTGDSASSSTTGDTEQATCMGKLGPAPVLLGGPDDLAAPGAYVVLAKAAITNVPGTTIDGGHVGVSPAAASSITGFALVLAPRACTRPRRPSRRRFASTRPTTPPPRRSC